MAQLPSGRCVSARATRRRRGQVIASGTKYAMSSLVDHFLRGVNVLFQDAKKKKKKKDVA
jgi:hypothetical protein